MLSSTLVFPSYFMLLRSLIIINFLNIVEQLIPFRSMLYMVDVLI